MLVNSCKLKDFPFIVVDIVDFFFSLVSFLQSPSFTHSMTWQKIFIHFLFESFFSSHHSFRFRIKTQKYSKNSPRWQYNNSGNKDIKAATELLEDERDPDVIPAQFCKLITSDRDIKEKIRS